jgi:tetratricopeptide (TPR) repeat protein
MSRARHRKTAAPSWPTLLKLAVILAAALGVYGPVLHGAWLWDDNLLITTNPRLRDVAGLSQIWFAPPTNDYWPLTWTLLWGEWHLWQDDSFPYHVVSVALHVTSGLLLWRLLGRLGVRWAWVAGLLFVIHPLAIESVAWVAEIKNTFSLPFFLLSCDAWLDAEEKRPRAYLKSILYYLAAMLAKTSTVMLPVVLLLYCWWKRRAVTLLELRRMIPYLLIAVGLGLLTVYFQNPKFFAANDHPHYHPIDLGGPLTRALRAGTSVFFYLGKTLLPVDLAPVYPASVLEPALWLQVATVPCLAALLFCLWKSPRDWSRHLLFGLGFFLINILPVVGLVRMKYFEISWVADHLIYIALIGPTALAVAGVEQLYMRAPANLRLPTAAAFAVILAGLTWYSRGYASLFADPDALWTYGVTRGYGNYQNHYNLGETRFNEARYAEGLAEFTVAYDMHPGDEKTLSNMGTCLDKLERRSEAMQLYRQALTINPDCIPARAELGTDLALAGDYAGAITEYQTVLRSTPDDPQVRNNLGAAFFKLGRAAEAVEEFEKVMALNPNYPNIQKRLGAARELAAQSQH